MERGKEGSGERERKGKHLLSEMQTKAHKLTEKWKLFTRTQRSGKTGRIRNRNRNRKKRTKYVKQKPTKNKNQNKNCTTKEVKAKSK